MAQNHPTGATPMPTDPTPPIAEADLPMEARYYYDGSNDAIHWFPGGACALLDPPQYIPKAKQTEAACQDTYTQIQRRFAIALLRETGMLKAAPPKSDPLKAAAEEIAAYVNNLDVLGPKLAPESVVSILREHGLGDVRYVPLMTGGPVFSPEQHAKISAALNAIPAPPGEQASGAERAIDGLTELRDRLEAGERVEDMGHVRPYPPAPAGYRHKSPPEKRLPLDGDWYMNEADGVAVRAGHNFTNIKCWILDPIPDAKAEDGAGEYGEPWSLKQGSTHDTIVAADGVPISVSHDHRNYHRMIACVNALAGVPDVRAFVEGARVIQCDRDALLKMKADICQVLGLDECDVVEAVRSLRSELDAAREQNKQLTIDSGDARKIYEDTIAALRAQLSAQSAENASLAESVERLSKGGVGLIAAERERQMSVEGWTPEHDDTHVNRALAYAASCYCLANGRPHEGLPLLWPWDASWWKPSPDPIRNLVKAGALIAAEIDRLLRAALTPDAGKDVANG